jgi:hypothetical protein
LIVPVLVLEVAVCGGEGRVVVGGEVERGAGRLGPAAGEAIVCTCGISGSWPVEYRLDVGELERNGDQ